MAENPFDFNSDNPFANEDTASPADNPFAVSRAEVAQPSYPETVPSSNDIFFDDDDGFNHNSPPPASSKSNSVFKDPVTGIPLTDEDLRRREEVLSRREREIENLENRVSNGDIPTRTTRKNFPPLLKLWAYHPDEDLPEKSRSIAKQVFYIFNATVGVYLVNCIGCFCCLASARYTSSPASKIVLSLLFLIVFCPISFEVSYFILYDALSKGKGLRFFIFMFTYLIWCGILVFNLIGIDDSGSVGFIQMINLFAGPVVTAVVALVFCIAGSLDVAAMVFTFIKLFRFYRTEGLEKKAFGEAALIAAEKAKENKDTIAEVARENPEFVANTAAAVTTYT